MKQIYDENPNYNPLPSPRVIKIVCIIAVLIFAFYFAWIVPQIIVAIQITSEAMNLSFPF